MDFWTAKNLWKICEQSALAVSDKVSFHGEIRANGIIKYGILTWFLQTISVILPSYSLSYWD